MFLRNAAMIVIAGISLFATACQDLEEVDESDPTQEPAFEWVESRLADDAETEAEAEPELELYAVPPGCGTLSPGESCDYNTNLFGTTKFRIENHHTQDGRYCWKVLGFVQQCLDIDGLTAHTSNVVTAGVKVRIKNVGSVSLKVKVS